MALIDYVLSRITDDDHAKLDPVLDSAAEALSEFVHGEDFDKIMQRHNKK